MSDLSGPGGASVVTVNGLPARPLRSYADLLDLTGPGGTDYSLRALYFECYLAGCEAVAGDSVELCWKGRRGLAVIEEIAYPTRESVASEPHLRLRSLGTWPPDRWDG